MYVLFFLVKHVIRDNLIIKQLMLEYFFYRIEPQTFVQNISICFSYFSKLLQPLAKLFAIDVSGIYLLKTIILYLYIEFVRALSFLRDLSSYN